MWGNGLSKHKQTIEEIFCKCHASFFFLYKILHDYIQHIRDYPYYFCIRRLKKVIFFKKILSIQKFLSEDQNTTVVNFSEPVWGTVYQIGFGSHISYTRQTYVIGPIVLLKMRKRVHIEIWNVWLIKGEIQCYLLIHVFWDQEFPVNWKSWIEKIGYFLPIHGIIMVDIV